jgi:hypothetical protein
MNVLRWIAIIFAAGFIGYFGRYLAKLIIEKVHTSKVERSSVVQPAEDNIRTSDYKREKKRLKIEMKRQKKRKDS